MTEDYFDKMFNNFRSEAFRLETLGEYKIYDTEEYEEYKEYLNGAPLPKQANQEWRNDLKSWKSNKKEIIRVRILPEPITPYINYELDWCYPYNSTCGEKIYVIGESLFVKHFGEELISDFWMFDGDKMIYLDYSNDGEYLGCKFEGKVSEKIKELREKLLQIATPLHIYMKTRRISSQSISMED